MVTSWEGPIYDIEVVAPDLGWRLRVESFRAVDYTGELVVDDPDGIVVDACFVDPAVCAGHLRGGVALGGRAVVGVVGRAVVRSAVLRLRRGRRRARRALGHPPRSADGTVTRRG